MKKIQVDPETGRRKVWTENNYPSKTDPSFQKDTDVNQILNKFIKTGHITHLSKIQGTYGDVSEIPDLYIALQKIKDAENEFMRLPAKMRRTFHNDPKVMLTFLADPKNDALAIEMGLKVLSDEQIALNSKKSGEKKSTPEVDKTNPEPKVAPKQ